MIAWGLAAGLGLGTPATGAEHESEAGMAGAASDRDLAQEDRIHELERQLAVVVEELARVRTQVAVPEEAALESVYGLGPAASKIYGIERGLSFGGYGEAFYRNFVGDTAGTTDTADFLRLVMYFGYKFTDSLLFNAEIEYEHAKTSASGSGSVSVEFAALDFLLRDWANIRAGLLLVPMGFLNELHEPPFFYGVNRPEVERQIIPSTWRENGAGLFGHVGEQLSYRAYVVNGFDAQGFSPSGLRGGRQNGSKTLAEDLAFVGRLDWTPLPEVTLGGSVYTGDSGQDQTVSGFGVPDANTTIWEAHAQYREGGFSTRGLVTMAYVDDADDLTATLQRAGGLDADEVIAERMLGAYGEVAYDLWGALFPDSDKSLEPFFRVEFLDTQDDVPSGVSPLDGSPFARDRSREEMIYTVGASFRPHPNVVLKADYRNRDPEEGERADELNVGIGFAF